MNKLADNAADTARNLNADNEDTADTADTGNDNGIAEILGTPAGPETEATAMLMISLGIALNPRARSTNRRKAAATLRRVGRGLDRTRPHPVEMLAADLLDDMQHPSEFAGPLSNQRDEEQRRPRGKTLTFDIPEHHRAGGQKTRAAAERGEEMGWQHSRSTRKTQPRHVRHQRANP